MTFKKKSKAIVSRLTVYLLAVTVTTQPLLAQVTVDQSAPVGNQAQIDQAPNGVPVVNIANPSQAGVSRNEFQNFNVGQEGLIFNNSREVVDTQLSGFISGNTQLDREASIILNEVNGANRTQLEGFAEIAGQGANLIIANPNGITCDGCGFINTPRTTLTTGSAIISGGDLQGFNIQGGDIAIEGAGLNANGTEQLDLLSRAINLNAQVQGNQVNAILGRNDVTYNDLSVEELESDDSQAPLFALDASALGALQAGQIRLIGTEDGVGVNIPNNVSSTGGDISISADGRLVLGTVNSARDVELVSGNDGVKVNDVAFGENVNINVSTEVVIGEDALVAATQSLDVDAATLNQQGDLVAGLNRDGTLNEQGQLTINAQVEVLNFGQIQSTDELIVVADVLSNEAEGQIVSQQSQLTSQTVNNQGLVSSQELSIDTSTLNNNQGIISAQNATFNSNSASNVDGSIEAQQIQLNVENSLNNNGGLISQLDEAQQQTTLNAGTIDNLNGTIQAASQRFDVVVDGVLNNEEGQILNIGEQLTIDANAVNNSQGLLASNGNVEVSSATTLNNNGGQINGDDLDLNAESVTNQSGEIQARETLALTASNGSIDNQQGTIESFSTNQNSTTTISATESISNVDGLIQSLNQAVNLESNQLVNDGSLSEILHGSNGVLTLTAQMIENLAGASISSNGTLLIEQANSITNSDSNLVAVNASLVSAGDIDNQNGLIQADELNISAEGALNNTQSGVIRQTGTISQTITAGNLNNNALIESAAEQLSITVESELNNQQGEIVLTGEQQLIIESESVNNTEGRIATNADINVSADQLVINDQGVISGQSIDISANEISNRGSETNQAIIEANQNIAITARTGGIDNQGGSITSLANQGQTQINAQTIINNNGGSIQSNNQQLLISAQTLNNNQNGLVSNGGNLLQINADQINNVNGSILANMIAEIVESVSFNNQGGVVSADQLSLLIENNLTNQQGTINANELSVEVGGLLNNSEGQISQFGEQDQTIIAGSIDNTEGGLIQTGATNLNINVASELNNSQGRIIHSGNDALIITSGSINNQRGEISNNSTLELNANGGLIDNDSGLINGADVALNSDSIANNNSFNIDGRGVVEANQTLTVNADISLDNSGGVLRSVGLNGSTELNAGNEVDNTLGVIETNNADLTINTQTLINDSGRIQQASQEGSSTVTNIVASVVSNINQGLIVIADFLSISDTDNIDNTQGSIQASQLSLSTQGELNNTNGVINQTSNSDQQIDAQVLINSQGRIESLAENFIINSGSQIDNLSGTIAHIGQGTLELNAQSVNNQQGALLSNGVNQITLTGELDNSNTSIIASNLPQGVVGNQVVIQAQGIDNSSGRIQSSSQVTLDALAGDINNQEGVIIASANDVGSISTVDAQTINNVNGSIRIDSEAVTLTATNVENDDGEISHAGTGTLTLDVDERLSNRSGLIESNGSISISNDNAEIDSLDNTSGQISALQRITIFAQNLLNEIGLIETSIGDIDITASETFDNSSSQNTTEIESTARVIAGNNLNINTADLSGNGLLQAGVELDLSVTDFSNESDLRAGQDLIIRTADFLNDVGGSLTSDGNLTFDLTGDFTNNGLLSTLADININANTLTNNGELIVGRDGLFTIVTTASNTGTLTSAESLTFSSLDFSNEGAFGSGGDLLLNATNIENNGGGAIFSGSNATFLGQNFRNSESEVLVLGDFGFAQAFDENGIATRANTFLNTSGRIEAQGSIGLFADDVNNIRTTFESEEQRVSAVFNINCIDCSFSDFIVQYILREEFATVVTAATAESNLIAGGDLFIEAQDFLQEYSVLAAGGDVEINSDTFTLSLIHI